tara:strand:+ start:57 stop:551 length:495 start_codon:yes stop_codon:yes gene_type:complete
MLTQDLLKEFIFYDLVTGGLTWLKSPAKRVRAGDVVASINKNGYIRITLKGKHYLGHRLAWFYLFGVWPNQIDHINGVRTDNRIENLRDVIPADNSKNRALGKSNKSGVIGVRWVHQHSRWTAQISVNGKNKALGYFKEKELAIKARLDAESEYGYHKNHGRSA